MSASNRAGTDEAKTIGGLFVPAKNAAPTPLNAIRFQPTVETCQSPLGCEDGNEPEWVVEFGDSNKDDVNRPAYVCTDCLASAIDFSLEVRINEIELGKHECNTVRVARYLPDSPTIQSDTTID